MDVAPPVQRREVLRALLMVAVAGVWMAHRLVRIFVVLMLAMLLALILAVVAGAELGGITGIFVAIPVIALLTVLGRHWHGWRVEGGEAAPAEVVSHQS